MKWKFGDIVRAKAFPNEIVTRRVVGGDEKTQTVHLCNEDEYHDAIIDGREPTAIGFPACDILDDETSKG